MNLSDALSRSVSDMSYNNSSQSLEGTFEGKASEAAQQSINKLKNNNENLKQKFETLLNTLKINGWYWEIINLSVLFYTLLKSPR